MRHLKFRAWDPVKKVLYHNIMIGNTNDEQDNYVCPRVFNGDNWQFLPEESMQNITQWTNFTDNNGYDIFEGDHIDLNGLIREVYYNEDMGQWECRTLTSIEGVARILRLSYCISTGYILNGHKWI